MEGRLGTEREEHRTLLGDPPIHDPVIGDAAPVQAPQRAESGGLPGWAKCLIL